MAWPIVVDLGTGEGASLSVFVRYTPKNAVVWTVDNDARFFDVARARLERLALSCNKVRFIVAPLESGRWEGRRSVWYGRKALEAICGSVDLLFVDGPKGQYGRFPALPAFYERLARPAAVLLDDCQRRGEQATFDGWRRLLKQKNVAFRDAIHNMDRQLGDIEIL